MNSEENKICGRLYVEIEGRLQSPLLIGSGEDCHTDYDLLLTPSGEPFIPGSSLAGALRSYLVKSKNGDGKDVKGCENESDKDVKSGENERDGKNEGGEKYAEELFGTLGWALRSKEEKKKNDTPEYQSRLFVSDAVIKDYEIIRRDGVGLDQHKTAREGAKFELQAIQAGAKCTMRFEIVVREKGIRKKEKENEIKDEDRLKNAFEEDLEKLAACISGMSRGSLRVGAKSRRGFGRLTVDSARKISFDLGSREAFLQWLDWDWEKLKADDRKNWKWEESAPKPGPAEHHLVMPLAIKNTILIRDYAAFRHVNENDQDKNPSFRQLMGRQGVSHDGDDKGPIPVIPGTTWAGAVRSYVAGMVCMFWESMSSPALPASVIPWEAAQRLLEPFFGTWAGDGQTKGTEKVKRASCLVFDESIIEDGHSLHTVRNAIDRFTGGSANRALFEEAFWTGGETALGVRWDESGLKPEEAEALLGMLIWAAWGLENGFLTVGGETAVGRGIFEQTGDLELDGVTENDIKTKIESGLKAAAAWCKAAKKKAAEVEEK